MRRISILVWSASVVALIPLRATPSVGLGSQAQEITWAVSPTRVRLDNLEVGPRVWSIDLDNPAPVQPLAIAYGSSNAGNSSSAPEIISRVGEILGVIDNPEKRNQLAEQWLQYSKQVIAKDQELREQWLKLQREQLAQQDEAMQLHREIAQLQMRIEELHAQNLRLEQENLRARQQLAEKGGGLVPQASTPVPPSK